ncbi:hydrolase [Oceanicola sp. 22II-s10i]|nr:hydrolase [Oceanicola sp. 22II-s10i]
MRIEEAPFWSDIDDGPAGGKAVWVHTADGVRIRVGAWPLDDAAAARGTVLLFPGRTEYIEKYGRAAGDFAARGYATLAVDWRGQGFGDRMTDNPLQGHVGRFSDYQLDVAGALAAAEMWRLPKPWHLLGHSMGGCIGLRSLYDGMPVASAAFTGPMWGIALSEPTRTIARLLSSAGTRMGLGKLYAPGTVRDAYVMIEPFEGNRLTNDPEMYDYMRRQTIAHPEYALAGPTLGWLHEALKETAEMAQMPAPDYPCITFLGTREKIVDVPAVHRRMESWPNGRLELVETGEHEVMMDTPEVRKALFDTMCAHFDAHGGADQGISTALRS